MYVVRILDGPALREEHEFGDEQAARRFAAGERYGGATVVVYEIPA